MRFFWEGLCFGGTERFSYYQNFTDLGSMRNSQSRRELSCDVFSEDGRSSEKSGIT